MAGMKLLAVFARNFMRIGQDGANMHFDESVTTVTGPSGSGKSSMFRVVESILALAAKLISEPASFSDEMDALIQKVTFLGVQSQGLNVSGSQSAQVQTAGLKLRVGSLEYLLGLFSARSEQEAQFRVVELDVTESSTPLMAFEERCATGSVPTTHFLEDVVSQILILPQDHGLRGGVADTVPFKCTHLTLFPCTVNGKAADAFNQICGVQLLHTNVQSAQHCALKVDGSPPFALNDASGGQWDCFFTLCAAFGLEDAQRVNSQPAVVLLDEPGQNLSPFQREQLRSFIHEISPAQQVIVVTHHSEMLDRRGLPYNVLRLHTVAALKGVRFGFSTQIQTSFRSVRKELLTQHQATFWKSNARRIWSKADNLSALFAPGFLIVEGSTDERVLHCLDALLRNEPDLGTTLGLAFTYSGLQWKIISGDGIHVAARVHLAVALEMPFFFVYDFDKMFQPDESRNGLYGASQVDRSKRGTVGVWCMSHLGGHASASIDRSTIRTTNDTKHQLPKMLQGVVPRKFFSDALDTWAFKWAAPHLDVGSNQVPDGCFYHAKNDAADNVRYPAQQTTMRDARLTVRALQEMSTFFKDDNMTKALTAVQNIVEKAAHKAQTYQIKETDWRAFDDRKRRDVVRKIIFAKLQVLTLQ